MDRWQGKLAVITGASAGIGSGIAVELVKAGLNVVGLARRVEKVIELRNQLPDNLKNNLHALKCDVSKEEEIVAIFKEIDSKFGAVSVLVNNAGTVAQAKLLDPKCSEDIKNTVNLNMFGLIFATREAFLSMKKHNIKGGHIFNINSVFGHKIPFMGDPNINFNVYPATKFGVTALTESYRHELIFEDMKTRITSVSPGLVKSEASEKMGTVDKSPHLYPKDIADAIIYALGTPEHVQIHEITIKPIGEPF